MRFPFALLLLAACSPAPTLTLPVGTDTDPTEVPRYTPRWAFEPWISKDISTGPDTYAFVDTAMGNMVLRVAGNVAQRIGDPVRLAWEARDLHLFNAQTGARIG